MTQIRKLDMSEFISAVNSNDKEKIKKWSDELVKAFTEIGFVVVKNHLVSEDLQRLAYEKIDQFFKLPLETKQKYEGSAGGQRGYTSFGKEHSKDHPIGDLKEFFHFGPQLQQFHYLADAYPKNVKVDEVVGLNTTLHLLHSVLNETGQNILRALSYHMTNGHMLHLFSENTIFGNSILRPINYPPLTGLEEPGSLRSAPHEDINLITLLIGASSPGLEVKTQSGEWLAITTEPNELVVNVGDMLQRYTNHALRSTTHRVVNPPKGNNSARYSIPFFLHPVSTMNLKAHDSTVSKENPQKDPDITAGEYLQQRLKEIGLA